MKIENIDNFYPISDLKLAATLRYCGYKVDHLDRNNRKRVNFMFKNSKEIENDIKAYHEGELLVDPLLCSIYEKELKNRLYSDIEY